MESSASSLAYLRLFNEEVIGVTTKWNLFGYKCHHCGLYGVIEDPPDKAHATIQWRDVTFELLVATGNDYINITYHCCELSSDEQKMTSSFTHPY
jgi:hypothetical protein